MNKVIVADRLLTPEKLYSRKDILISPSSVPLSHGIYAWYFKTLPGCVPALKYHSVEDHKLLYVGVCPIRPPKTERNIRKRIKEHLGSAIAEGSTLRFSLGTLLGIRMYLKGSSEKGVKTFSEVGENELNMWLDKNAKVAWCSIETPWVYEDQLLKRIGAHLPLNIKSNPKNKFRKELKAIRKAAVDLAVKSRGST